MIKISKSSEKKSEKEISRYFREYWRVITLEELTL